MVQSKLEAYMAKSTNKENDKRILDVLSTKALSETKSFQVPENPEEDDDGDSVGRMGTLFFDKDSSDEEELMDPQNDKLNLTEFDEILEGLKEMDTVDVRAKFYEHVLANK